MLLGGEAKVYNQIATIARKGKAKEVVKFVWREVPDIVKEVKINIIPKIIQKEVGLLHRENVIELIELKTF